MSDSQQRTWSVLLVAEPEQPVGEVVFTPAGGEDPFAGSTEFKVLRPAGEGWLLIVSEFVQGEEDCHVFLEGSMRPGPHDGDLRQLEGALRLIPQNYPVLAIGGLEGAPPQEQAQGEDPAVEAAKTLVRERARAALVARGAQKVEGLLISMLRRVNAARGEQELADALQGVVEGVRSQGSEPLAGIWDEASAQLRVDAEDPALSPALGAFLRAYTRMRVQKPPIVH